MQKSKESARFDLFCRYNRCVRTERVPNHTNSFLHIRGAKRLNFSIGYKGTHICSGYNNLYGFNEYRLFANFRKKIKSNFGRILINNKNKKLRIIGTIGISEIKETI